MITVAISICCLIFLSIMSIAYFSKKRMQNVDNKIFSIMIITNLLGILIDVFGYISFKKFPINSILNKCISKIYVVYFLVYVFCLFIYIYNLTFKNIQQHIRKMIYILVLTIALVCILPITVHIESKKAFSYGPSVNLTYTAGIILIILMLVFLFIGRKKLKSYTPLLVFVALILMTAIIQKINPEITLMLLSNTVVTLIMYFTIENPDMKMIEQLELAKEQAEKANHAKTEFLSSMSHEIRTPLNAIVGFSDFIVNADSLSEAKENAKDIINASTTLLEIVNGILDISKIEAGKLEIINSKYKAYDTFESLAKLITPKMQEKGLDFTYYIAKDLPDTLYGDHANIKKVITNLLSNAAKYTEKGFVRYEVNCVNDKDYTKLIISVEDSGRGIKKENVDKLFTKFQRLDEDKNTTIEGTGLGLAITKQLVELMNGKIIVQTLYGKGSKFTIILNQKITESIEEKKPTKKIDNSLLTKLKILVVDDNTLNLKVTRKILNRFGINNVECVESGFACLEKIESKNYYDLILLDDMMPKMNGSETLKKLKQIPEFNTRTIALTANALTGMREKYLEEGFDGYLSKPIDKDELIKELNNVLIETDYTFINKENKTQEIVEELIIDNTEKENISSSLLYLKKNNIDVDRAIELLGDIETFNETLKDFITKLPERFKKLELYKNEKNMAEYAIEVHALKSDCKYLGITSLAEIAYEHELKSKENDAIFIINHYQSLEDEKNRILSIIEKY